MVVRIRLSSVFFRRFFGRFGCRVSWSVSLNWLKGAWLCWWVRSLSFILHIGYIAIVTINMECDLLQATIGKLYIVGSLGVITVTGLLVTKVVLWALIWDSPLEVVLGLTGFVGFKGLLRACSCWGSVGIGLPRLKWVRAGCYDGNEAEGDDGNLKY